VHHVPGAANAAEGALRNSFVQARRLILDIDQPILVARDDH
jgi:hypothetical protein